MDDGRESFPEHGDAPPDGVRLAQDRLDGRTLQALLDTVLGRPAIEGVPPGYQLAAVLEWADWWPDSVLDVARWIADPRDPTNEHGAWNTDEWKRHYAGLAAADAAADDGVSQPGLWAFGADGLTPHVLREVPGPDRRARAVCGCAGVPYRLMHHRFGPCRACMKILLGRGASAAAAALDPDW